MSHSCYVMQLLWFSLTFYKCSKFERLFLATPIGLTLRTCPFLSFFEVTSARAQTRAAPSHQKYLTCCIGLLKFRFSAFIHLPAIPSDHMHMYFSVSYQILISVKLQNSLFDCSVDLPQKRVPSKTLYLVKVDIMAEAFHIHQKILLLDKCLSEV